MKVKMLILGMSMIVGANFAPVSAALDSCSLSCMQKHNYCVESGGNEAVCEREYKACRAGCVQ
ncbi:hypothetical protein MJ923_10395 [Shewanella sp. 3B26]|uniref:Kazal-like domain-containing protein n=1 Tax=Shewanella zhuhaiensis TaxID=2919576 RepID=A0AAJ1EY39_9GAMM|nr:hypothetical protein [Shewanella zhuhaiensis]MCH4294709.1 hypothetical protein [Shewanella zhuhaiensis]